ncbi:uncharacterized protein VTP21DRAFT_8580 [Calcarisporiella thermophila]|uniref:uncharacterized protein n=1 Tax=Calcarisporiella thermophila TaxID=911321 RepID=UPI0037424721
MNRIQSLARLRMLPQALTSRTPTTIRCLSATSSRFAGKKTHLDAETNPETAQALKRYAQYTVNVYARPPLIFTHGKGCYVFDSANRRYLDFTAGISVNALGHADPEVAQTLYEQANRVVHLSNLYHNEHAGELAQQLIEAAPGMQRVFFSNSGTEANEGALKFARKWGKHLAEQDGRTRWEIVSFEGGFHGRSMGALSVTPNPKYQKPFAPLIPGVKHGRYNDVAGIRELITPETCAVIVEPIQGEGGVHVASEEFLRELRRKCDEVGALLIFDEIQCGLSRTGKVWAHQHLQEDIRPDILTVAKPLANGVPIGAILVSERVADVIKLGEHGTTFGGNPLACSVARKVFSRLSSQPVLDNVRTVGDHLRARLDTLRQKYPSLITEIRGRGLILGVQFTRDPTPLTNLARERGLLIITAGKNTIRVVPPLVLTREEADQGVRILEEAVEEFHQQL